MHLNITAHQKIIQHNQQSSSIIMHHQKHQTKSNIIITCWWSGTFFMFPQVGNVTVLTNSYFSEGQAQPPTRDVIQLIHRIRQVYHQIHTHYCRVLSTIYRQVLMNIIPPKSGTFEATSERRDKLRLKNRGDVAKQNGDLQHNSLW